MGKEKEPWQIAAARYCLEKSETGFLHSELQEFLTKNYNVNQGHIQQFIEEEILTPSGRNYSRNARSGKWIPPLDLVTKITDYDELKEARKNSRQAFWLSVTAIIIAIITLLRT